MQTFICPDCLTVGIVTIINDKLTVSPCDCVAKEVVTNG